MNDDLVGRMGEAAGTSPSPALAGLWQAGRRRRRNRRLAGGAGAAVAVVLLAAVVASGAGQGDGSVDVASGPTGGSSTTLPAEGARCEPGPSMEDTAPPATAEAFVTTGSGQAQSPVTVAARAEVVRSWWLQPETVGPDERSWQHRIELEVTDPVTGAAVGDHLTVFDAMGMSGPGDKDSAVPTGISGAPCHFFTVGDDVIVSLSGPHPGTGAYELNGGSAFFLIERGRFAPALDAGRRAQGWDGELMAQARELAPDQFLDVLREAATGADPEAGDDATWTVSPDGEPTPTGSTFTALVTRTGCAGGQTGTVLRPGIRLLDYAVEVRFTVEALPPGTVATCQGNTAVPVEVDIGEPLGTRELIDAACVEETEGAGTAACLPNGKRWPG